MFRSDGGVLTNDPIFQKWNFNSKQIRLSVFHPATVHAKCLILNNISHGRSFAIDFANTLYRHLTVSFSAFGFKTSGLKDKKGESGAARPKLAGVVPGKLRRPGLL